MLERLPPGARTPAVARALLSPSGILLAGLGASVGILTGGGLAGAALLGALAWGGRVAAAVMGGPRPERIDPFTVQDPWRAMILRAQSTATRFHEAVRQTSPGPLRNRLAEVQGRVDAAVREAWAIAKRGHALDNAVQNLDIPGIRRRLVNAERTAAPGDADDEAIVRSLRNQLQSAERLAGVAEDAGSRLARLNAELEESVARAVELSLSAADAGALQPLGTDVEHVVNELESLRLALDEAS